LVAILEAMGSNNVEKTAEQAVRPRQDLLAAWLAALNRLDNPMRRRAAKCRQGSRSLQIAPQQIGQTGATIPLIFNRANLRRLV
jgi:hypothetical protein